ncbi:hypothetical protein PFISCL1PPCAC_22994, partial [Pristionchus fissidentatus]
SKSEISTFDATDRLFSTPVELTGKRGPIAVNAVFQDTLPSGSSRGTVVTMHGSPGSHKDFKYITPLLEESGLRVVGTNFPGFGLSSDSEQLVHTNQERAEFIEAIMDNLNLNEKVLFLAHSRGCETALRLTVNNQQRCFGMALINHAGFKVQRAIRPYAEPQRTRRNIDSYSLNIIQLYTDIQYSQSTIECFVFVSLMVESASQPLSQCL